jgi:hypothetical protein
MPGSKSLVRRGAALLSLCFAGSAFAADKPDFTGVWGTYRAPGTGAPQRGAPQAPLPLRAEAKAKIDAYHALVDPIGDTPGGHCLGTGMPGSMLGSGGYPMEIVQHENIILVVFEAHAEIRRIYLTDAANPEDLFPDRNGYSVGRWDGDKLIVETTHLKEAVDQSRYPHGENAKIVEEYSLEVAADGTKVLTAQMTMTDPDFYTKPVAAEKKWQFLPGVRLLPYECNEPEWEDHIERLREQQVGETG